MTEEKKRLTSDGKMVTKQEYIDSVKAELLKLEGMSDEELEEKFEEELAKEPEGPTKEFMKVLEGMVDNP